MAESSEGWDGTIDEAAIARILSSAVPGSVSGPADFRASVAAGQRRVILTPGESHDSFIRYVDTNPRTIDLDAPAVGRWDLIVQRRDWANNTVSLVTLKGGETAATIPALPSAPPAGFLDNPGVAADMPLWWAWVNAANNNVVLRDARHIKYEGAGSGLPDPMSAVVTAAVVTAAAFTRFGPTVNLVLPQAAWVRIDIHGWIQAAASNELRVGVSALGDTVQGPNETHGVFPSWGSVLWVKAAYEQRAATKTLKVNAGTTAFRFEGYRQGSGLAILQYADFTVVPERWA